MCKSKLEVSQMPKQMNIQTNDLSIYKILLSNKKKERLIQALLKNLKIKNQEWNQKK